jgi:hypothetical protein
LTPAIASHEPKTFFVQSTTDAAHWLAAAGTVLKGFTVSLGPFDLSSLLGEQASRLSLLPRAKADAANYLDNQYSVLALRMRVAERVSVGGSLGLFYLRAPGAERDWVLRASYGITLSPSRSVLFGVSYLTLPGDVNGSQRNDPERLVDGSVNLGVSFHASTGTIVALDFRNLVEEGDAMVREPHFGIEQNFLPFLALRGGAFYQRENEDFALSGGIGLLDTNWRFPKYRRSPYPNWAINYGVVREKMNPANYRFVHALTISIRL